MPCRVRDVAKTRLGDRVAPLRMGARRAAPGSQVLSDFEVISCP